MLGTLMKRREHTRDCLRNIQTTSRVFLPRLSLTIAVARLCYLEATETSFNPSSKLLKDLIVIDPSNLESRALLGWHLSHQRRSRSIEDQEQKHYVANLRHLDKHDTYSLIGLANWTLRHAREMRPQTEIDRE